MASVTVVSNRLPARLVIEDGQVRLRRSDGGLVSALSAVLRERGGAWVGWPGRPGAPGADAIAAPTPSTIFLDFGGGSTARPPPAPVSVIEATATGFGGGSGGAGAVSRALASAPKRAAGPALIPPTPPRFIPKGSSGEDDSPGRFGGGPLGLGPVLGAAAGAAPAAAFRESSENNT